MLSFEQWGKVVMDILSGSFISEKWKEVLLFYTIHYIFYFLLHTHNQDTYR